MRAAQSQRCCERRAASAAPEPSRALALGAAVAVAAVVATMLAVRCLGAGGGAAVAAQPGRCLQPPHRFRPVRLVPLAARARLDRARACRFACHAGVSAPCAGGVGGAARLRLHRDCAARPVRDHRQAADRARAPVRRRRRRLGLSAVRLAGRLCELAVRPCHHRLFRAGRDRRAVSGGAAAAVDLCRR